MRHLLELADVFFMNEEEATGLFGSLEKINTRPGAILYVTLGKKGAIVVQGDFRTELVAPTAKVLGGYFLRRCSLEPAAGHASNFCRAKGNGARGAGDRTYRPFRPLMG